MKKNSFLTFCLALVPGMGQMYLGYLLRGVSLMSLFCLAITATSMIYLVGFTLPVIWAFAFFDTFRLRDQPEDQPRIPDGLIFGLSLSDSSVLQRFLDQRHKLIGWALVLLGGWLLLDRFVLSSLRELFSSLNLWPLYTLIDRIPTLIVAALLVVLGICLMRPKKAVKQPDSEFRPVELPPEQPEEGGGADE